MAATLDTLALAAEERAKQGIHELEISFGGELDLHKHLNDCDKNPGHRKFIPIRKLTQHHIPKNNYEYDVFEWVRNVSRYTVKLSVHWVSPNRPPGYPLSDRAGQRVLSVGSGYVADIPSKENDKMPCPFTNCTALSGNHEVFGYITVVTAAHVVFDDEEAKNTTVEFFYDDPDDRSGVITARGVKVAASSVEGDFCELFCLTHNASLVQRLNKPQINMPRFTVKFSLRVNRPTVLWCTNRLYPKSGHVGLGVLSVGCESVSAIPFVGNYILLQYPFENLYELTEDHEVHDNIPVVTPGKVDFDDEEANNAALEFFHDGLMGKFSDVTRASTVPEDFCQLLCVTHNARKFQWVYSLREIVELSGRRICDLFQTLLPGIENIECTSGLYFQFLIKIRLGHLSEALQSLALLRLFTVEDVNDLLNLSLFGYDSSHDLLKCTIFRIANLLHLIESELHIAEFVDESGHSTSFLDLCEKLTDLHITLREPDSRNHKNCWHIFLSIISGLVQFYSTVDKLGERLSLPLEFFPREFDILNRWEGVSIREDSARVAVTIPRSRERNVTRFYNATSLKLRSHCGHSALGSDGTNTKCRNESDSTAKECNPNDMFLVHIAHPHGQSKQVTIGRQTDCFTGEGFYHQLYTAPTCPGCSGGPVWMIPASGDLSQVYGVLHSGHIGNDSNRGCSWTVYPHQFQL